MALILYFYTQNFYYLLQVAKNPSIPIEIRRLLWFVWKSWNGFVLEGKVELAFEIINKVREESFSNGVSSKVWIDLLISLILMC